MNREALSVASLAFGVVTPIAYVVQRLVERAVSGPVDPTMVLREAHTSFYWRCLTSAWWGGVAAVVAWWLVVAGGRSLDARHRWWVATAFALGMVFIAWRHP